MCKFSHFYGYLPETRPYFHFPDDNLSKEQGLLTKLAICIDIIKILLRTVICPSIIFFPEVFATITLIHKQIIAVAGYYACGAFIYLLNFVMHLSQNT